MTATSPTTLRAIATATPPHELRQGDAVDILERLFSDRFAAFHSLRPVFVNAGIDTRRLAMPVEWYIAERDWKQRTDAYLETATALFRQAAIQALNEAGLLASEIDAVITVSSTGIATPTLEARIGDELGFRPDCLRVPVFGLGCAGGVTGLSLATRLACAEPGTRVLMVAVELCSLSFRLDKLTKANIVATALFSDGAAAAVVSSEPDSGGIAIAPGREHRWPQTLGIMGWNVDPVGFEVVFDRDIPPFARQHMRPAMEDAMRDLGVARTDLARLSFHPGGTKVLEALEDAFELQSGSLDIERAVLRRHGNMSAPTALFVLKEAVDDGLRGTTLLSALGPGFTASMVPVTIQ